MKERIKRYRYSEIFGLTIQGEGRYVGIPTAWVRFFGCNFSCMGFGQADPLNPDTWVREYENVDLSGIEKIEDVPVIRYGCDSGYSWAKRYAHLAKQESADQICNRLEDVVRNEHNPDAKFLHPQSNQYIHLAFTGGEPMMQQSAIVEIMEEFERRNNVPLYVTVETNGTQRIRDNFANMLDRFHMSSEFGGMIDDALGTPEWFWSCSPKLSASGEKWEDAIKPGTLFDYYDLSKPGQLKFVVDGTEKVWQEVEKAIHLYRSAGITWPVWIMPVGAANDQQEDIQAAICEECFRRGYNFSARVHAWIFGNCVGK